MMNQPVWRNRSERVQVLQEALPTIATAYDGKALILPSINKVCQITGLNIASFYNHPGGPEGFLKESTGLDILSRNATVLGTPDSVIPYDPLITETALYDSEVQRLAEEARDMSPERKLALIARLAIDG